MRSRLAVVIGLLAVFAAACSSSPASVTPSSTTTTGASSTTSVTPSSTTTPNQSANKVPPVPHCYYTGSGYGLCEGIVLPMPGTVVLFTRPDDDGVFKLTGPAPLQTKVAVACGDAGCVYNHLDWSNYATLVSGCQANTTVCNVRVTEGLSTWTPVFVRQNNDPAILYLLWNSGKPGATISGYVLDKDEQAVQAGSVSAQGRASATARVDATTGFYAMNLKAGDYTVTPSGGPSTVTAPRFEPQSLDFSLAPGDAAHANFTLNGGLKVTLTLSSSSVKADGLTVVKGEIRTSRFGSPDGDVTVTLRPKPSETGESAVTTGVRAAICDSAGTRIWPAGSLLSPSATPVDVVTNAEGLYDFTMTVGTVPGAFPLNAWAKNSAGTLITSDLADTSPDETLTVAPTGNLAVGQFLSELALLKSDAAARQSLAAMTNDPTGMTQALSKLSVLGSKLGGLAYSVVNGVSGGGAVLVYDDTNPPSIGSNGQVTAGDGTLVLAPGLWVGTKLIPLTALNVVIQKGLLNAAPTFGQWTQGTSVPGWKLTTNTASVVTNSFQYNGWAYPSTTAGACY
ncbi:MAG: carboxypeptidase-like regulatory domain-containing protein [Acidimicrobiales bacterium]